MLEELERQLREENKWALYATQVAAEGAVSDEAKAEVARRTLRAPIPVAMGLLLQSRKGRNRGADPI